MAREAGVVGAVAHRHPRLGGHQHVVAAARQRLAEDLLRGAVGVDVGRVDHVDAGVEAHVDLAARAVDVRGADVRELAAAAEGHRAEGERGDAEAGAAELAVVHARKSYAVEHAHGLPAQPRRDVLDRVAVEHLVGPGRHVAEVGREQRARRLAQLAVLRQRLLGVDVERGAGDRALAQRRQQRVLVDDRPARGVDQQRRRLHQRELARADQPARAVAEPRVDREHVASARTARRARRRWRPPRRRPRRSGSRSTRSPPSRTRGRSPPSAARGCRARGCRACGRRAPARSCAASRPRACAGPPRGCCAGRR